MSVLRIVLAYGLAVIVAFIVAVVFFTQQVIAMHAEFGGIYTREQQFQTLMDNLVGLAPAYGVVLALGLAIGFVVAAIVKRVVKPLARIAYPIAGAAAVVTAILLIENLALPGYGVVGGVRDAFGMALQGLAGAAGGLAFAMTRGGAR